MSSILKALKRVEASALPEENGGPAAALRPHALRGSGRSRRVALIAAGLLTAAVAAASGLFLFGRDGGGPPPAGIDAPPGAAAPVRAKIPDAPGAAPKPPIAAPAAEPPPAAEASVEASPPPLPRRPAPQGLPPRPVRPAPAREAARPAAAEPAPSAPRSAEDRLSRLEGSKLKLMAIAWYPEPARRIAVINGSIIKEGESVEGFRITQIRKDDVVVSDGSRSWRVEFGLKTQP